MISNKKERTEFIRINLEPNILTWGVVNDFDKQSGIASFRGNIRGYVNIKGEILWSSLSKEIICGDFYKGMALIQDLGEQKSYLVNQKFDTVKTFSSVIVREQNNYFFHDKSSLSGCMNDKGDTIISCIYGGLYSEGKIIHGIIDTSHYFYNKKGVLKHKLTGYNSISLFSGSGRYRYLAKKANNEYVLLDQKGKLSMRVGNVSIKWTNDKFIFLQKVYDDSLVALGNRLFSRKITGALAFAGDYNNNGACLYFIHKINGRIVDSTEIYDSKGKLKYKTDGLVYEISGNDAFKKKGYSFYQYDIKKNLTSGQAYMMASAFHVRYAKVTIDGVNYFYIDQKGKYVCKAISK